MNTRVNDIEPPAGLRLLRDFLSRYLGGAPKTLIHSYNTFLVVLSVVVAMLASYAALDLAGRVRSESGATRLGWLAGGATVMGLGIWSMHFVGMLAFHLPVPIGYDVPLMLLSMVVAIAASLIALMVIGRPLATLVSGGITMGGGIAGMHYIGMASMRVEASRSYSASIVVVSVLIAMFASLAALWLLVRFRSDVTLKGAVLKALSAVVMGFAIAGMHYTGMAAARFAPGGAFASSGDYMLASGRFGEAVVACAILIIGIAIVGAVVDRNIQARAAFTRRLGEQARQLAKSEEQYRLVFDHNPNPMCVYDASTLEFLAVNEAGIRQYGYSREEFLSMTRDDFRVEAGAANPRTLRSMPRNTGAGRPGTGVTERRMAGSLMSP